jgi:hypothetical protein
MILSTIVDCLKSGSLMAMMKMEDSTQSQVRVCGKMMMALAIGDLS